jgi:hypothetical protein
MKNDYLFVVSADIVLDYYNNFIFWYGLYFGTGATTWISFEVINSSVSLDFSSKF